MTIIAVAPMRIFIHIANRLFAFVLEPNSISVVNEKTFVQRHTERMERRLNE